MQSVELNRLLLPINSACAIAGILAYATMAPGAPAQLSALNSLGAFVLAFFLSSLVARHMRNHGLARDEDETAPAFAVKILLFLPAALCGFEVFSLVVLCANPDSVSWIHIVVAMNAGGNAAAARRSQ